MDVEICIWKFEDYSEMQDVSKNMVSCEGYQDANISYLLHDFINGFDPLPG